MATFNDRRTQTVVTVHRPEEDYDPRHEGAHDLDIAATLGRLVADITTLPRPLSCIFFHLLTLELRRLHLRVMMEGAEMLDRTEAVADSEEGQVEFEQDLAARLELVFDETEAVIQQLMAEEQSWGLYRERYAEIRETFQEIGRIAAQTGLPAEIVAAMMGADIPRSPVGGEPPEEGELDAGWEDDSDPDLDRMLDDAGLGDDES